MRKFSILLILILIATVSYADKWGTNSGPAKPLPVPGRMVPYGETQKGAPTVDSSGNTTYQYSGGTVVTVGSNGITGSSKVIENSGGLGNGGAASSGGPTDMTGFRTTPTAPTKPWEPAEPTAFEKSLGTNDPSRIETFNTGNSGPSGGAALGPSGGESGVAAGSAGNLESMANTGGSSSSQIGLDKGNFRLGESGSSTVKFGEGAGVAKSAAATVAEEELAAAANKSLVGLKLDCSTLDNAVEMSVQVAPTAMNKLAINLKNTCLNLKEQDDSCFSVFDVTKKMCHTEENENIASSVTMIQTLMSVASGVTNACNNFGKAMDVAKKAMALYTTACGAAQVTCNFKCGAAMKSLSAFHSALKTTIAAARGACPTEVLDRCTAECKDPQTAAFCIKGCAKPKYLGCEETFSAATIAQNTFAPELTPTGTTIANKVKICKVSVAALLGTAIINIGTFAQSKAQADQCKADSQAEEDKKIAEASCNNIANRARADCACTIEANKTIPHCVTELASRPVDCALAENSDKPICICRANPRMTGCEGVSTAMTSNSTMGAGNGGSLGGGRGPSNTQVAGLGGPAADGSGGFAMKGGNKTDGSSASGAGGGGGGSSAGLSDSGGGSGSGSKGAAAAADSGKLSANILDSGAGGGGGFGGKFGGGDYNSPEYRSRLKSFAAKNGIGTKIAGSTWTDQVTGMGGKSNFDKIKARYQENKATLLGGR